ncbi:hypothetical protein GGU10DRAFT_355998 [Lentinula aff. detonsa]|uniref:Secreted protein n=1 Tax=Lentinula aff. detonsa TaxID=2804958 RepID=A0AA38L492_9AGAR|nr:hypothetical protein GGU10DRAFT_355998 [Lentinula aff. detonsa]
MNLSSWWLCLLFLCSLETDATSFLPCNHYDHCLSTADCSTFCIQWIYTCLYHFRGLKREKKISSKRCLFYNAVYSNGHNRCRPERTSPQGTASLEFLQLTLL